MFGFKAFSITKGFNLPLPSFLKAYSVFSTGLTLPITNHHSLFTIHQLPICVLRDWIARASKLLVPSSLRAYALRSIRVVVISLLHYPRSPFTNHYSLFTNHQSSITIHHSPFTNHLFAFFAIG
jgi:hypothetical protein